MLERPPFAKELAQLVVNFSRTSFRGVFRASKIPNRQVPSSSTPPATPAPNYATAVATIAPTNTSEGRTERRVAFNAKSQRVDISLQYSLSKKFFKGADAQLRDSKKIRKQIKKHCDERDIRALIDEHDFNVSNTAKSLLEKEIFVSTLRAKIHFPEVFEVSPAQSAERVASEAEAGRSEADAIRDVAEGRDATRPTNDEQNVTQKGKAKQSDPQVTSSRSPKRSILLAKTSVPSLYPVYLPLRTQYLFLVKVQALLENACYDFGVKVMRDVLEREGWDSAECVEPNIWARTLLCNAENLASNKMDEWRKPLPELLNSITQIRHTAVHRVRVSANKIEQSVIDAEALADFLGDDSYARTLSRLRREIRMVVEDSEHSKDLLESKYMERRRDIAARRAELDRLERLGMEEMLKEDQEYQRIAGANLEQTLSAPETAIRSLATFEHDMGSEADLDTESVSEADFNQVQEDAPTYNSTGMI